jgi:S1-C subfamily serine protease
MEARTATITAADVARDTCVLRTPAPLAHYVASFRRFDDLIVGEEVFAIGAPHGYESSVSSGIVSGKRLSTSRRSAGQRLVQSSAPIAPGSSGGGLFDARGNLVGNTASALPAWPGTFGFAIAVDEFGE